MKKVTAGRDILVEFAPKFAELITHIAFYVGWPKAWSVFNMAKEIYKD